jgi:hypothetical protein
MKLKFPASLRVIGLSVVDWWDSWLDLVGAVLVWTVAQVTIVFGPPATLGLFYTVHALINGESLGARGILEGGGKYFGKSWLWMLLNILVLITVFANLRFYGQLEAVWAFYIQVLFVMLTLLWFATQFYTLAFLMEMKDKRLLVALRNGFFLVMASPVFSFFVLLFALFAVTACLILILPIFFGIPALVPILSVRALYDRLEAFGLREPDKDPKQLEREQSSRIEVPRMNPISNGEGQVEEKH